MERITTPEQFVSELILLYPLGKDFSTQEAIQAKIKQYTKALTSHKDYDYDKLLDIVSVEYKFKNTPEISWLIEKRNACCEKTKEASNKIFCVFFENGIWLDFVYCGFGNPTSTLKEGLEKTYGKIKTTRLYPAGTTIMRAGKDGVFKVFPPQGETQILDLNN